ncbi:hypothetical protein [Lysobacter sp. Root690]|uniref:hypothetical protein n=1 Tax=Lysobacter sp. Root690 TaxID=1736588 RepID=UPI0006F9F288|nr:hypothetical protein [Lysobacter sp. Root690]KRB07767.1 hypothetical protein ASD86_08070 [Lysobacter sp. Root690]
MHESKFGFEYHGSDLQPIRPLVWVVTAAQLAGGVLGYTELSMPDAFDRIWTGGAMASLPGYLAGCALQALMRPGSFPAHRVMLLRLGLLAALVSVAGAVKYWWNQY